MGIVDHQFYVAEKACFYFYRYYAQEKIVNPSAWPPEQSVLFWDILAPGSSPGETYLQPLEELTCLPFWKLRSS